MNTKNFYWIIAGAINLFTFILHLTGGQVDHVDPMMDTTLTSEQIAPLIGAWHMVTIILFATSYVLLLAGFGKRYSDNIQLISICGYLNLAFCFPFVFAGFYYGILAPQWILFLPIGVLTFLGIRKVRTSN